MKKIRRETLFLSIAIGVAALLLVALAGLASAIAEIVFFILLAIAIVAVLAIINGRKPRGP